MYTAIIISRKDIASLTIEKELLKLCDWKNLGISFDNNPILLCENKKAMIIKIENDIIYSDYLNNLKVTRYEVSRLVFASRHSSETKKPSLHVHFTGNWGSDNRFGGEPYSLSIAEPIGATESLRKIIDRVSELKNENFSVSLEVTHHGPTEINIPLFFIELGSSEKQWKNIDAAKLLAEVILEISNLNIVEKNNVAIGFGGPHYAPAFTNFIKENEEFYISHIAPKYHLDTITKDMVSKMIRRSSVKPKVALLDWKGMKGSQRKKIMKLLEEFDLQIEKI